MNLEDFIIDEIFGERLLISKNADALDECYVVHNSKAVVVKSDAFTSPDKETIKNIIYDVIEKLRT